MYSADLDNVSTARHVPVNRQVLDDPDLDELLLVQAVTVLGGVALTGAIDKKKREPKSPHPTHQLGICCVICCKDK